ncbi:MAG: flap endonuclease-1 [Halobacteriales archaeon]
MGNAALRELAVIEPVAIEELRGWTLAVDAHNWLYRYLTITVRFTDSRAYTTGAGDEVANLIGILQGVAKLLEGSIRPLFVFDGEPSVLKTDEIERRREAREAREAEMEAARERGDAIEAARLDSQSQRLTDVIQTTSRGLLERLDLPYLEAPAEGEAQAADLAARGVVDAAGTEDYDALLFGAPVTIRQLTSSGNPERMDLAATLDGLDLSREQLVDVAILVGTDYNDGLSGYGPKTAVEAVREHGDLWGVLESDGRVIPRADGIRELFLDPRVDASYEGTPTTPSPDLDAVRRYVVDEWEVDPDAVERPLERIAEATAQTGLGRFG